MVCGTVAARASNFAIARIAGAQPLRHAVGAHRPPFIVIAPQPDIVQVAEAGILRDLLRRQMAVVIENRLLCRVVMVQTPGKFAVQQEIFAQNVAISGSLPYLPCGTGIESQKLSHQF